MSYSDASSETFLDFSLKLIRTVLRNPVALGTFMVLYGAAMTGFLLYNQQKATALKFKTETERLNTRVANLEEERHLLIAQRPASTDIFKRLSFLENSSAQNRDKLQAAMSLNSFARYALNNQDLQKARETLELSMRTFPTLEAEYYLGLLSYMQGHNEDALASWTSVSRSSGAPSDIFLYLSVAEYRSGNSDGARRYAELFSRSRFK